jgi:hypothetical protein
MNTVFDTMKEKMNKTIMALEKEFAGMRAGRATPAVLDMHLQTWAELAAVVMSQPSLSPVTAKPSPLIFVCFFIKIKQIFKPKHPSGVRRRDVFTFKRVLFRYTDNSSELCCE